jgi:DNA-binding CsgD family transcriptional regulator
MICTTDDQMLIDRVGAVHGTFGYEPAELLGRPILSLVDAGNVADMRVALEEASRTRAGVVRAVGVRTKSGEVLACEAVVIPMVPSPSSAFALVPEEVARVSEIEAARQRFVQRLRDGVAGTGAAAEEGGRHSFSGLTPREMEVVGRLLSGDRVRSIAEGLFLSPSTVRNHLSSVYRKLGIRSQQEIIDRFRATELGSPISDRD